MFNFLNFSLFFVLPSSFFSLCLCWFCYFKFCLDLTICSLLTAWILKQHWIHINRKFEKSPQVSRFSFSLSRQRCCDPLDYIFYSNFKVICCFCCERKPILNQTTNLLYDYHQNLKTTLIFIFQETGLSSGDQSLIISMSSLSTDSAGEFQCYFWDVLHLHKSQHFNSLKHKLFISNYWSFSVSHIREQNWARNIRKKS